MFFNLVQSPQPYLPFYKKILMILDLMQQKSSKITTLSTNLLLTENRKDIEYRLEFLKDVFDKGVPPNETLYYHFINDDDKGVILDGKTVSRDFISLLNDIKNNKILEPIAIGHYSNKIIKTRHILKGKKIWKEYENENGYQIINGGHRLAVALFLGLEKVPVKIYRSVSFEIPNYTDYIKDKESEYIQKIKKLQKSKK
jgi:hypothetical protein